MASVAFGEAGTVREDETGTSFQVRKAYGGIPHILVGVGAREAMGTINVYGGGMYIGEKAGATAWQAYVKGRFAKANLITGGQPDFAKIARSSAGRHFMVYGRMPRCIDMSFVRDVRADQVSEAYTDAWDRLGTDTAAAGEALTQFMAAVNHPVKSGQHMVIRSVGNNIWVQMPGQGTTKVAGNRTLVTAIWQNYFGARPLQRPLRDALMSKLSNLHALSGN